MPICHCWPRNLVSQSTSMLYVLILHKPSKVHNPVWQQIENGFRVVWYPQDNAVDSAPGAKVKIIFRIVSKSKSHKLQN